MNIVAKRVKKVLERMIDLVEKDGNFADSFSTILESGLEDMACDDEFGSEGQVDPRGDGRNGDFNMDHVEGVDTD